MAYKTPEDYTKDAIIKFLKPFDHKHQGALYWKRRDAIGANYEKGIPDLFIVIGALHIEVECKRPGGSLSPLQEKYRDMFMKMNTPYILCDSIETFNHELLNILQTHSYTGALLNKLK